MVKMKMYSLLYRVLGIFLIPHYLTSEKSSRMMNQESTLNSSYLTLFGGKSNKSKQINANKNIQTPQNHVVPYNTLQLSGSACRLAALNLLSTLLHSVTVHWYLSLLLFIPIQAQLCWNKDREFKGYFQKSEIIKPSGTGSVGKDTKIT